MISVRWHASLMPFHGWWETIHESLPFAECSLVMRMQECCSPWRIDDGLGARSCRGFVPLIFVDHCNLLFPTGNPSGPGIRRNCCHHTLPGLPTHGDLHCQ